MGSTESPDLRTEAFKPHSLPLKGQGALAASLNLNRDFLFYLLYVFGVLNLVYRKGFVA